MNIRISFGVFLIAILLPCTTIMGQSLIRDVDFSGQFFFSTEHTTGTENVNNEFFFKRGYITFRKDITERVGIRFTQDVSVDQEGDGAGDIELRLKYALVDVQFSDFGFLKNQHIEFGVVHRPWIDFEQDINDFRSQNPMFLDSNNYLSSADYGFTYFAHLGEELPGEYQDGLRSPPGRYGSFSIGIYNGGGYSRLEQNNNKLLEARLSLRLFPDRLPGLQTTVFGDYGKGNHVQSPDFRMAGGALSFESKKWAVVGEGFIGVGDGDARYLNEAGEALATMGWSIFQELKPFSFPVSLTLRYDELVDRENKQWFVHELIAGVSWVFPNRSKIILSLDQVWLQDITFSDHISTVEIITEIRF
ncbi:hypothetical protein [Rhodohalobacter mucosus]|uniref:Phosphate-selective porin O and P n=1 Tax=Rhodohalobacter mucosus TaxID=2079485 RepID=A0A316TMM8_9BACT|nr:hypothetical protein [Rhodohalobacter mucosus]PWN05857.1 hypothetical protein DDZ15_11750 [Rhodohalobacter mucosus]